MYLIVGYSISYFEKAPRGGAQSHVRASARSFTLSAATCELTANRKLALAESC